MRKDAERIDEYTKTGIHIKNQGQYPLILEPVLTGVGYEERRGAD